jgi:hypothetical protein
MADVVLAILILLPAVITYFLKSNAALSFLALCGGFAVITLSGSDIQHLIGHTKITSLTSNNIDLALLIVPLLFTLFFTFRSVSSKNGRLFSILPALCAGGLLAIVAAPMVGSGLQTNITNSKFWHDLQNIQSYIVSIGLLASLLLVWSGSSKRSKKHK